MSSAVLAGLAVVAGVLAGPATAAPAAPAVVAHVPHGFYDLEAGLGSMWAMGNDERTYSTLYRIDPSTNRIVEQIPLGYPAAFLTFGYGSVWVSDYYGSRLYRYAPDGTLQARIRVGLQPQFVLVAFGSVWTSNHHAHSLSRVDPATNTVVATVDVGARMFRDGPQEILNDGRNLYVGSSNLTYYQRIDPTTDAVTDLVDIGEQCCSDLLYAAGTIWQLTTVTLIAHDLTGAIRLRIPADPGDRCTTAVVLAGRLWYGENTPGGPSRLRAVDDRTGARITDIALAGRAGSLAAGFGSVWNVDWNSGAIERFTPAAT